MKWLIAPTSLKRSLTAKEAAEVIAQALISCLPESKVDICPVADGGTGTLECLIDGTKGHYKTAQVIGPSPQMTVDARWGVLGDKKTAVIEMAEAAGLHLLKTSEYNPLLTTSYGVGELIRKVLESGFRKLIIGLGGSATIDGGLGCLQALGVKFWDNEGKEIPQCSGGGYLNRIKAMDISALDSRLAEAEILLLADVRAVLYGEQGAAALFGPQKGASPHQIQLLDQGLKHFAQILNSSVDNTPGSGAAGGLAAGLAAICHVPIHLGIEVVLDLLDFDKHLAHCDGVITAEGKLDIQTCFGKAIQGIALRAQKFHKPVHAFTGQISGDPELLKERLVLTSLHGISPSSLPQEEAVIQARILLDKSVQHYFSAWFKREAG